MTTLSKHTLERQASQMGRCRSSRILAAATSTLMAASLIALPAHRAFADEQVLEIPQAVAPLPQRSPKRSSSNEEPASRRQIADAALPAGFGDINEYEHQDGERQPRGTVASSPGVPFDANGGRNAILADAVMGALALGVLAMQIHAAHQHHHR